MGCLSTTSDSDPDIDTSELVETDNQEGFVDLESQDLGLDEIERLSVYLDKSFTNLFPFRQYIHPPSLSLCDRFIRTLQWATAVAVQYLVSIAILLAEALYTLGSGGHDCGWRVESVAASHFLFHFAKIEMSISVRRARKSKRGPQHVTELVQATSPASNCVLPLVCEILNNLNICRSDVCCCGFEGNISHNMRNFPLQEHSQNRHRRSFSYSTTCTCSTSFINYPPHHVPQRRWPRSLRPLSNNICPICLPRKHPPKLAFHIHRYPTLSVPLFTPAIRSDPCQRHKIKSNLPRRIRAHVYSYWSRPSG